MTDPTPQTPESLDFYRDISDELRTKLLSGSVGQYGKWEIRKAGRAFELLQEENTPQGLLGRSVFPLSRGLIIDSRYLETSSFKAEKVISYTAGTIEVGPLLVFHKDGENEVKYIQNEDGKFIDDDGNEATSDMTAFWLSTIAPFKDVWAKSDDGLTSETKPL